MALYTEFYSRLNLPYWIEYTIKISKQSIHIVQKIDPSNLRKWTHVLNSEKFDPKKKPIWSRQMWTIESRAPPGITTAHELNHIRFTRTSRVLDIKRFVRVQAFYCTWVCARTHWNRWKIRPFSFYTLLRLKHALTDVKSDIIDHILCIIRDKTAAFHHLP